MSRKQAKQTINYWKWAFIALILIIVIAFIYLFSITRPVSTNNNMTENTSEVSTDYISLSASIDKDEAQQIMNTTIQTTMDNNLTVELSDQVELHGDINFIGLNIPYALYLSANVIEDGNIQFYGESVELANIDLPVSTVMSLLANQIDFPHYVSINSEEQTLNINLDRLLENQDFSIDMTQINLTAPDNHLRFDLSFDESLIEEALQNIEN